jgi:hypothetical protein
MVKHALTRMRHCDELAAEIPVEWLEKGACELQVREIAPSVIAAPTLMTMTPPTMATAHNQVTMLFMRASMYWVIVRFIGRATRVSFIL